MLRLILRIALNDLRRVVSDRSAVIWMAVMPVAFAGFFGLVTYGGGPVDVKLGLAVVDEDRGPLARVLVEALESERLVVVELDAAGRGSADGPVRTLVIPEGFSDRVAAGEQTALRLETKPGASEEASLAVSARILGAVSRVIGRLIAAGGQEGTVTAEELASLPPQVDLVTVDVRWGGRSRTPPGGFAHSIPGMAVMFVMLVALTYGAASLAGERQGGQLRRLATAPVSKGVVIAGKIAGRVVVAWTQIAILATCALVAHHAFGIPLGDRPDAVLALLLVFGLAVAPLGVLLGAAVRDPDRAASLGVVATMVMAGLGGCWWPLEVVSPTLQKLALVFPSGWAMTALHRLIAFGDPPAAILGHAAVLLAFGAVFAAGAARWLRVTTA